MRRKPGQFSFILNVYPDCCLMYLQPVLFTLSGMNSGQLSREEIELSSKDETRPLEIKSTDIEISNSEKTIKKYIPLSKRQDKPDSALWLIKHHNILKDSQIAKLVGITKNSVTSIRNKSYWNYNNLNPKDPVALNLFTQKDLINASEKAERRIKREKKEKEKVKQPV